MNKAVVDLANRCSGTSVYVILSRVKLLEDLLILWPFPESVLDLKMSQSLVAELKRLELRAKETEKWNVGHEQPHDICTFYVIVINYSIHHII